MMSWDMVSKTLLMLRLTSTTLVHQASHLIAEGYEARQGNPYWWPCCPPCVWKCFPQGFSASPSRDWGKAVWPIVPRSSFLPFLKIVVLALFQSSGTSTNCHDHSKIMNGGLIMTSDSFISTHGCNLSGLMDLHMTSLFKCSLIWSFSTSGKYSLLQTFPLVLGAWDSWRLVSQVKTKAKKASSTSAFFLYVICNQFLCPVVHWTHCFPNGWTS